MEFFLNWDILFKWAQHLIALAKFKNIKFSWKLIKLNILSTNNNLFWMNIMGRSEKKNYQFGEPLFWLNAVENILLLMILSVDQSFLNEYCWLTLSQFSDRLENKNEYIIPEYIQTWKSWFCFTCWLCHFWKVIMYISEI